MNLIKGQTEFEYRLDDNWQSWLDDDAKACYEEVMAVQGWEDMQLDGLFKDSGNLDDHRPVFFAGPWFGEFGWELMRWQGGIRKLVQDLKRSCRVVVMGPQYHNVLYEYADEYWNYPMFFLEPDLDHQCMNLRSKHAPVYLKALAHCTANVLSSYGREIRHVVVPKRFYPNKQSFIQLGPNLPRDVPSFAWLPRGRKWTVGKNWLPGKWTELVNRLQGETSLLPVKLTERTPLHLSIANLLGAQFSVCSEGGGIFLSLLCGTPTIAFGHERWHKRVMTLENPLHTPVKYIKRIDNNHTVSEILDGCKEFLCDLPLRDSTLHDSRQQ